MARNGIVCGVSWCVDRNNLIDRWPEQETLAVILSEERQGGGNGANGAVDLKKLGAPFPIEAIGLIGDDDNGVFLKGLCRDLDIDARQLHVAPGLPTAVTNVMTVATTGKRTFFYRAGTHEKVSPDHVDFGGTNARILHLGLPGTHATMDGPWHDEPSGWTAVLKKARAAGIKTNFELCSTPPGTLARLVRPCLPLLDYLIINDAEAGEVTGIGTLADGGTDFAACEAAAKALLERSAIEMVAVHFPLGAVVMTRDGTTLKLPSVRVPQGAIKSSNGAGDAFAAGMLLGLHESWPLEELA